MIDQLAADLRRAFPEMQGFSPRNLKYMRAFAAAWPDEAIMQQLAAQIPWFHNCILLDKLKDPTERAWYVHQTIAQGWSRNVLVHQIESGLYRRQGQALTNFDRTLPAPQSDLARQASDGREARGRGEEAISRGHQQAGDRQKDRHQQSLSSLPPRRRQPLACNFSRSEE